MPGGILLGASTQGRKAPICYVQAWFHATVSAMAAVAVRSRKSRDCDVSKGLL